MTKQAAIQSNYFDRAGIVTPKQLDLFKKINAKQDRAVFGIFYSNPSKEFSPFMIQDECRKQGLHYEITSVRRSIHSIAKAGKIICTGSVMERLGKPNLTYKLK